MQVYRFSSNHGPRLAGADDKLLPEEFFWFDVTHNDTNWSQYVKKWVGLSVYEQHVQDTFNPAHAPFYDVTDGIGRIVCTLVRGI